MAMAAPYEQYSVEEEDHTDLATATPITSVTRDYTGCG